MLSSVFIINVYFQFINLLYNDRTWWFDREREASKRKQFWHASIYYSIVQRKRLEQNTIFPANESDLHESGMW
jgi:hypothetical protein